jgi:hypothetical protein
LVHIGAYDAVTHIVSERCDFLAKDLCHEDVIICWYNMMSEIMNTIGGSTTRDETLAALVTECFKLCVGNLEAT